MEKILSVDEFKSIYHTLPPCTDPFQFLEHILDRLNIDHRLEGDAVRAIPSSGPALELGRTFIRVEYQKDYSPLMLLWKGIGQYVVQHFYYKTLFGAVSISDGYGHYSRQLMGPSSK